MAGSNGLSNGDISSSSRSALVMPPGEKAALFYHRLDDVCGVVTELLKDSIRQGEMCRFMFRTPQDIMRERIKNHGLDLDEQPSIETVHLSQALIDGYDGLGIGEHVRAFVKKAKGSGYSGARLILNMPELMDSSSSKTSGWSELDTVREELGVTLVCLYDMSILSPGFLLRSLSSYPNVIIDGTLCRNFYYVPSMTFPQRDAYRDLYEQLESIREERDIRQNNDQERLALLELNREMQEEMAQRRMVEFALLRAENNLRTMLDAMSDMVFMIDRDLRVTNGNQTFLRYLEGKGFDTSYEGRFVYDMFPGAPLEGQKLFEEVFRYGLPTVIEELSHVDGELREAEVRLVPVKVGSQVDRVVVIVHPRAATAQDVEGMWEKAEVLREEFLDPTGPAAGAMEFCPHPVLITDRDGGLYRVNTALGREMGCSEQEVLAMGNAHRFLSPQKDEGGQIRRISADGQISIPSVLTRKDGSTCKVMCYVIHATEGAEPLTMTLLHPGH